MTTTTAAKPATAEDFLALAREALGSGYITAGECELKVSNAYVAIAEVLACDPDAISDLMAAHRMLVKALRREYGQFRDEVDAALTWINIARVASTLPEAGIPEPKASPRRRIQGTLTH
jgi:hypothetical protein